MNKLRVVFLKYKSISIEAKASFWYTVCSILQRGISFLTIPIFTRILTTGDYGEISIYTSWLSIVMIFTTLNLQYGSFNTAMIKFENKRNEYISSIEGICMFLSIIALVLIFLFPSFWVKIFDISQFLLIIMIIEIFSSLSIALWSGKKRFENKYVSSVSVTLILSLLSPLLSMLFILAGTGNKATLKILGNTLVYLVVGACIFLTSLKKCKNLFNAKFWKYAISFNLPLLIYYLSQVVFNQTDRIMIQKMVGFEEAGIYSVAYSSSIILTFIINSINNAYVPWVYKSIKEKNVGKISMITNFLILGLSIMLFLLILFAPELMYVFAGEKYLDSVLIIPPVAASQLFLFLSQIFINIMFFYEDKFSLVKGSAVSAILNFSLNYLFIPIFGYTIAGYTTLLSFMYFFISNYYYYVKICKKKGINKQLFNMKIIVLVCIVFLPLVFVTTLLYDYFLIRISVCCLIVLALMFKRKKIIKLLKLIYHRRKY